MRTEQMDSEWIRVPEEPLDEIILNKLEMFLNNLILLVGLFPDMLSPLRKDKNKE